jgi:DNA gyrase subunit B
MSEEKRETQVRRAGWPEATFREAVRKRPAMYVGDVGPRGLHHLAGDILENSLLAGHASSIAVELKCDGSMRISVSGDGFSVLQGTR